MALGLLGQRCAQQQQQQRHQAGRQLLVEPGSVEVGCPGALAIAAGKAPRLVERQMAWMGAQMAEAVGVEVDAPFAHRLEAPWARSEEHTSELQSLMRISYAVFCLKKKRNTENT